MALQVWIPGTDGTLKNQGLYSLPNPSYNNIVSTNNGKLGKDIKNCAIYHLNSDFIVSSWSICTWVKFSLTWSEWNNIIFAKNTSDFEDSQIYLSIVNNTTLNIGRGASEGFTYQLSNEFQPGVWYHIAATYDGTNVTLYLNGSKVAGGSSIGNYKSALNLCIGCRSTNEAGTGPTGWGPEQNDIRLYDHCLSPKEVKEISKGLVLHYPLNDAYVEGTSNLFSADLTYHTNWNNSGSATWSWDDNTIPKINNSIIYSISRTDTGNSAIGCGRCNLVAGKTYTASVYVYLNGNMCSNIFYVRSVDTIIATLKYNNDANPQKWPQNQWIRATATFTPSATYNSCYICTYLDYANSKRALTCWQIEEKDHATPYTPNTRNETTVYDCSGYQNNGTISGALSCSADSPRYKISTVFDGISSKIINESFPTSIVNGTNPFTICGWEYCIEGNSYYPLFHIGSDYNYTNGICLHGNGNRIEGLDINGNTIDDTSGYGAANREWVYQCIVYDGTTIKRYLNGNSIPTQTLACSGFKSNNDKLSVGGFWGPTFKGHLSDFRIYATALSADDIKELYDTSAYVSDNGTLLTYSVEE